MCDCDLYARILNLPEPRIVIGVDLDLRSKSVKVIRGRSQGAPFA